MPCWPHAWLDQRIDLSTFRPRFDQRAWSRSAGRDASRTQADFDRLVIPRTTRRVILQLWAGLPRGVRSLAVEAARSHFWEYARLTSGPRISSWGRSLIQHWGRSRAARGGKTLFE